MQGAQKCKPPSFTASEHIHWFSKYFDWHTQQLICIFRQSSIQKRT